MNTFGTWLALGALAAWGAPAVASSCNVNPFGIAASIEHIEPPSEPVLVRKADGQTRRAVLFECLQAGDAVVLQGRTTAVELFMAGSTRRVSPTESPFVVAGGVGERVAAAGKAVAHWWTLRPRETGMAVVQPRIKADSDLQVLPWSARLAQAPSQWLLAGEGAAVLGWRASQAAAWTAQAVAEGSGAVQSGRVGEAADGSFAAFAFPAPLAAGERLSLTILDDFQRAVLSVPVSVVDGAGLPRPEGLAADWRQWPAESRTAWAAWIVQEGPPQWQLQALSWLYRDRAAAWLAGHLFYRSVNGNAEAGMR